MVYSCGLSYRIDACSTVYNLTGAPTIDFQMMVMTLVVLTDAGEARLLGWRTKSSAERLAQS